MSNTIYRSRDNKIAAWAVANPCATLQEIGDYYGVTRERVRQILEAQGVHKPPARKAYTGPVCSECGKRMPASTADTPLCLGCSRVSITMICSGCGKSFERPRSHVLYMPRKRKLHPKYKGQKVFCSNPCRNAHPPDSLAEKGTAALLTYAKRQRERTHCKYGHERNDENSYIGPSGGRICRPCNRRRGRELYVRNKEKKNAKA